MIERIATVKKSTEILATFSANPKSRYGQNFMVSPKIPEIISSQEEINSRSLVVEIGPGIGALTQFLAEKAKHVVCYEIDNQMCSILQHSLKDYDNVEIINQDILKVDLESINSYGYENLVVVSNLPYYITSEILVKLLLINKNITAITMMQKEVAHRILSCTDLNEVVLCSKLFSQCSKVCEVSKNDFFPKPKVDSTVLKFNISKQEFKTERLFFIKSLLKNRRKTIAYNLKNIVSEGKTSEFLVNKILSKNNLTNLPRIDDLNISSIEKLLDSLIHFCFTQAYCKLNLGLQVTGKENNYHKLSTAMINLELSDSLIVIPSSEFNGIKFLKDQDPNIENTYNLLLNNNIIDIGFCVILTKNIPIEAGLGGGSSDAISFLKLIKNYVDIPGKVESKIINSLGIDAKYFIKETNQILIDSVDEYKDLNIDTDFYVFLAKPNQGCSTKAVFDLFDKEASNVYAPQENINYENYLGFVSKIGNNLQNVSIKLCPEIKNVLEILKKYEFDCVLMTGTGSCCFGLTRNTDVLNKAIEDKEIGKYFTKIVRPLVR